jgi:hypothetical protein
MDALLLNVKEKRAYRAPTSVGASLTGFEFDLQIEPMNLVRSSEAI